MNRKKIFFLVGSLRAGGSERVFWLLAQGFDQQKYEIFLIHLGTGKQAYSNDLKGVKVMDMKTIKVSKSFLALYRLFKAERPHAVFSTGGHINILISIISLFISIPVKIAREGNVFSEIAKLKGPAYGLWVPAINLFYRRFDRVVCQSEEIRASFLKTFSLKDNKLIIIPNPVIVPGVLPPAAPRGKNKKILIVARLVPVKMHSRLLDILAPMGQEYVLTIAGDGPCRDAISAQISKLGMEDRVNMLGEVSDVGTLYRNHGLCVLSSICEGFPNALLESISYGTPVLAFSVGGLSELIIQGFNGFIAEQEDTPAYAGYIHRAFEQDWNSIAIRADLKNRFSLETISRRYEALIETEAE